MKRLLLLFLLLGFTSSSWANPVNTNYNNTIQIKYSVSVSDGDFVYLIDYIYLF